MEIEPLLTATNDKGEHEGVKYDRIGVVLINAVREQQMQIEVQQKQIAEQRSEIVLLKAAICEIKPDPAICKK